jgi:hypothetical protein
MSMEMQRTIFRFKRPSGSKLLPTSRAMFDALMLLSEAEELQPLFFEAENTGKMVAIEVFHNRDGHPILIHFTKEAA